VRRVAAFVKYDCDGPMTFRTSPQLPSDSRASVDEFRVGTPVVDAFDVKPKATV